MRELIYGLIFIFAFVFTLFAALLFAANCFEKVACGETAEAQNLKSEYGFYQGCIYILENGQKVSDANYRVIEKR